MVEIEQKRYADDITLQELVRLRVENERLREALQSIADNTCCDKCQEAALVARSALQQKDSE